MSHTVGVPSPRSRNVNLHWFQFLNVVAFIELALSILRVMHVEIVDICKRHWLMIVVKLYKRFTWNWSTKNLYLTNMLLMCFLWLENGKWKGRWKWKWIMHIHKLFTHYNAKCLLFIHKEMTLTRSLAGWQMNSSQQHRNACFVWDIFFIHFFLFTVEWVGRQ